MKTLNRTKLRETTEYRDGHLYWSSPPRGRRVGQRLGGSINAVTGYVQASFDRKNYSEHALVWAWHNDHSPHHINHINEIKTDNRIENLEASNPRHNKIHSLKSKDLPHSIYRNGSGYVARVAHGSYRWNSKTVRTVEEAQTLLEEHLGYNRRPSDKSPLSPNRFGRAL